MAAITPTLNAVESAGSTTLLTGSFTGVAADSHIALVPSTGHVQSFVASSPSEDATTVKVILNAITGGAVNTTNGSVRVETVGTNVYTFAAHVTGLF
jgi:hypothetical protein